MNSLCDHAHILNLNLIFFGDFNVPSFKTDNNIVYLSNSKVANLRNLQVFYNLTQYNSISNSLGHVLNLVFSTNNCIVSKIYNSIVKIDTHHPALEINYLFEDMTSHSEHTIDTLLPPKQRLNFHKAYYQYLYIELQSTDFSPLITNNDLDSTCSQLVSMLLHSFISHVP